MTLAVPLPRPPGGRPRVDLRVWLADLTYTQQGVAAEAMPQAIGGLATYAQARVALAEPIRLFKYPEALARALRAEGPPDVLGFSNYVWNSHLSVGFAARVKARFPGTVVVFGGPHYPLLPAEQERFLRERLGPAVDFYVDREGEVAFAELLAVLATQGRDAAHGRVPGVHSVDAAGRAHLPPPGPRLPDLTAVPSAYLAGLMDPFFDGLLVPTVQTNRGCPFTCTFCVEGGRYYGKVAKKRQDRVAAELRYIGERMAELVRDGRGRNELLITDSNFGMFPEDAETCRVIAECQDRYGWPRYVNVTTGKNRRDRVLAAVSQLRGAASLSGAVQSLDPAVLANVRRANIDPERLMAIALAAAERRTGTYSEVILGLPGDSKQRHLASLAGLIDAGFDRLNLFQLSLLPGSELYGGAERKRHGLRTRWRVVPRCFGAYEVLGAPVVTAEVDEVCVELPDLPYAHYRDCRRLDLLVAACYNDGPFLALVKLLRGHGVPVFRWLELIDRVPAGPAVQRVVAGFLAETDGQLWGSREALVAFARANIHRYLRGELGSNLLYTYRARLLGEALGELAALAGRACLAALAERGVTDPLTRAFVEEAAEYHRLRLAGVLTPDPAPVLYQRARFDVDAFLAAPGRHGAAEARLPVPGWRRFALTPAQRRLLAGYLGQFGATPQGAGRLLTKARLGDLARRSCLVSDPGTPEGEYAPAGPFPRP